MVFVCGLSRSGTTLLATVLDSHPAIAMGYELIPPPLPGPAELLEHLERGLDLADGDFALCGKRLRAAGERTLGLFFTRCHRLGLDAAQVRDALARLDAGGLGRIEDLGDRLRVAWRLARSRRDAEGAPLFGFKLNIPSLDRALDYFPQGSFAYIVRDPRDVVASHRKRGFDRTLEEICRAWNGYLAGFDRLAEAHPEQTALVRYEDLVSTPREVLERLFARLPVPLDPAVLEFHHSAAAVHRGGHPNSEQLRSGFFSTSVGRFAVELSADEDLEVRRLCAAGMAGHGYE